MEIERPIVSVIIPMYNVAKVLDMSFGSVIAQTQSNIEAVFVDDCSNDDTIAFLDQLRDRVTRTDISFVVLRHDVNRGVAAARNTGLNYARGKYVYFLDSDDHIDPHALETMVNIAERDGADIVGCDWKQSFINSEKVQTQPDVTNPDDAFIKLSNGVMRWNLWLYLINSDLYKGMRFIENANMGEDMMLILKIFLKAKRIVQTHDVYYHYNLTNSNSLTKSYMKHKAEMDINQASLFEYVKSERPDLLPNMYQLQLALKLPLLISNDRNDYEKWISWFPQSNDYVTSGQYVSKRIKLLQLMATKRQFWFVRMHHWLIINIVYGVIYR